MIATLNYCLDVFMSKLALKLIAENKKARLPFLDLGNSGLSEMPTESAKWLGLRN
ncbi:hypothetical protein [Methylomicrobium sp. Wu6]|uniref:hypothetical protein n=1 Tax=Methylomicrobium sp. Wu6 TaxID=3107928 RepID=UPI002DD6AF0C|nr:hypothetical protein [Methylomicrobium sp. Wu6]MEC4749322.1 hypothetical protein [Methylomicrobium sp. Wu6]